MNQLSNALMKVGKWADKNEYLNAVKEAFQMFIPFTIIGAMGTLWTSVLCNANTGLGSIFPPIMALSFLNPAFNAVNFCTIGYIGLGITVLVGALLGSSKGHDPIYCGLLSLLCLAGVSQSSMDVAAADGTVIETIKGIFNSNLGSTGIFTGIIVAICSVELFNTIMKIDALRIKMPDKVPGSVAKSFSSLVPGFLVILIMGLISLVIYTVTGGYLNDFIYNLIQAPLLRLGSSLPGILVFVLIAVMLWSVGLHGENMINGVLNPILISLMVENTEAVEADGATMNIINFSFYRTFLCTGGTGMVLALTIAFLITGKREENRSIAKLSLVSNLFNIGEVCMFGYPVVLNPILIIPFIASSLASIIMGYVLTAIHICPIMYVNMPWTMPPFLLGFLASGGNIMGGVCQLIALAVSTLIYLPFVKLYEKQQAAAE